MNFENIKNQVDKIRKRLAELRAIKHMSQLAVAKKMGISQNAYSKMERGDTALTIAVLIELAAIYNIPLKELFLDNLSGI